MDILAHLHIGLSTVIYLFGGQVTHHDSFGFQQGGPNSFASYRQFGRGLAIPAIQQKITYRNKGEVTLTFQSEKHFLLLDFQ